MKSFYEFCQLLKKEQVDGAPTTGKPIDVNPIIKPKAAEALKNLKAQMKKEIGNAVSAAVDSAIKS